MLCEIVPETAKGVAWTPQDNVGGLTPGSLADGQTRLTERHFREGRPEHGENLTVLLAVQRPLVRALLHRRDLWPNQRRSETSAASWSQACQAEAPRVCSKVSGRHLTQNRPSGGMMMV